MSVSKFVQAKALLNERPNVSRFVGNQPEARLEAAQDVVGCIFPPSYRLFLLEFGRGSVGSQEIYGIANDDFQVPEVPEAIGTTLHIRAWGLPHNRVVVGEDGMGGVYCVECSATDEAFEGDIRVFEPGLEMENQVWEFIAPSFGDYFLDCVTRAIAEQGANWPKLGPS